MQDDFNDKNSSFLNISKKTKKKIISEKENIDESWNGSVFHLYKEVWCLLKKEAEDPWTHKDHELETAKSYTGVHEQDLLPTALSRTWFPHIWTSTEISMSHPKRRCYWILMNIEKETKNCWNYEWKDVFLNGHKLPSTSFDIR